MRLKMICLLITSLRLFAMPLDIVTCAAHAPQTIKPGQAFDLTVHCDIQSGWYIYALTDRNRAQGVIEAAITCEIPNGFMIIDKAKFPVPSGHGRFQVFEGKDIVISQTIHTESSVKPGKYSFKIKFRYQTCNEMICLAPRLTDMNLEITVR